MRACAHSAPLQGQEQDYATTQGQWIRPQKKEASVEAARVSTQVACPVHRQRAPLAKVVGCSPTGRDHASGVDISRVRWPVRVERGRERASEQASKQAGVRALSVYPSVLLAGPRRRARLGPGGDRETERRGKRGAAQKRGPSASPKSPPASPSRPGASPVVGPVGSR